MAAARDQMALAAGGRRGAEAGPEARSRRLGGSARGGGRGRAAASRRLSPAGRGPLFPASPGRCRERCARRNGGTGPGGGGAAEWGRTWKSPSLGSLGRAACGLGLGRGGGGVLFLVCLCAVSVLKCCPLASMSVIKGRLHERLYISRFPLAGSAVGVS